MDEELEPIFGALYTSYLWGLPGDPRSRIEHINHIPDRLISQTACYYGPSFVIRKDIWEAAGKHRGKISHDYDHWLRVEEACWAAGAEIVFRGDPRTPYVLYNAHDERVTLTRKDQYDAPHWQAEARKRRGL